MTVAAAIAAPIVWPRRGRGRPSNANLAERATFLEERNRVLVGRNAELGDEIRVLNDETAKTGLYLLGLAQALDTALRTGQVDLARRVHARLVQAGDGCLRKGRGR